MLFRSALGYFYFVDRIGDTFRWKGENVSTTEVSEALTSFPGVKEATVYGVKVPHMEGRAGMVSLVIEDQAKFDLAGFRAHIDGCLPEYARPLFLRFQDHLDVTGTFKQRKVDLVAQGFDPAKTTDPLYFNNMRGARFESVDAALIAQLEAGAIRL